MYRLLLSTVVAAYLHFLPDASQAQAEAPQAQAESPQGEAEAPPQAPAPADAPPQAQAPAEAAQAPAEAPPKVPSEPRPVQDPQQKPYGGTFLQPAQEKAIGRMMGIGSPGMPGDCKLLAVSIEGAKVNAKYTCAGTGEASIDLVHESVEAKAVRKAGGFALVVNTPNAPAALIEEIGRRMAKDGDSIKWTTMAKPENIDGPIAETEAGKQSCTLWLVLAAAVVLAVVAGIVLRIRKRRPPASKPAE